MTIQTNYQNGNNNVIITTEHKSLNTAINVISKQSDNMLELAKECLVLQRRVIELETELKNRNDTIERLVRMIDANTPKLIQAKKKECKIIPLHENK